jgi:hypothetical protein
LCYRLKIRAFTRVKPFGVEAYFKLIGMLHC